MIHLLVGKHIFRSTIPDTWSAIHSNRAASLFCSVLDVFTVCLETLICHLRPLTRGDEMYGPRRNAAVPAVCDRCFADPQTGVAPGVTRSRNVRSRYRCSMCPAIHINSRTWLRSSSTHEPSDPPLRVVKCFSSPFQETTFGLQYVTCKTEIGWGGRCSLNRCQVPRKVAVCVVMCFCRVRSRVWP